MPLATAPSVSIITAVKNGEKYLEESLSSILTQTFTDFELIVINDYSSDSTLDILNRLAGVDSRIRVVTNQDFPGLSNALNIGISHARGRFLVRHDADDISKPNRLELQITHLEQNPDIDILGSYIEMMSESGEFIKLHHEPLSHSAIVFHTMFGTPFAHPSVVIRKSFLDKTELKYLEVPAQDYELWVRMLNAGARSENLPKALVRYRLSLSSDSNARALRHHQMAEIIKIQQILRFAKFPSQLEKYSSSSYQAVAHYLISGNKFDFTNRSKEIGKQIIDFFREVSSQQKWAESEISQLDSIMNVRLDAIKVSDCIQDKFKLIKRSIGRALKQSNIKEITPAFELTINEIQSFIKNVHVFIIVRDRLSCLQTLVEWLTKSGHRNITLVDNASTYPPLLEFLAKTDCKVIRLHENLGHTVLWKIPEIKEVINANWFVYTDPDVIPDEVCPVDAVGKFYNLLLNHAYYLKAGFGLRLDDLPSWYHLKDKVIEWETQYHQKFVEQDVFDADIDTTFALYRPGTGYCFGPALRTMGAYRARHLPWYLNSNELNLEDQFYREHALSSVTTWNVAGDVKSLPLPTTLQRLKRSAFVIASRNPVLYSFAIKTKSFLKVVKQKYNRR